MSSGAQRSTFYKRETTPGVTPSGVFTELKRTSYSLGATYNRNDNDEIAQDRMAQAQSAGLVDIGGDIGTLLRYGSHDEFLASAFGAEWVDDVLTMGNERITFSVSSSDKDVSVQSITRGAQVDTFALTMPNDGDITATLSMMGLGFDSRTGAPYYGSSEAGPDGPKFDFMNIKNVKIDGETLENEDGTRKACIDNFSLQFANNIQVQRCIGTGTGNPGANIPMQFTPSGQIVMAWSAYAHSLYEKVKSKGSVSFEFEISNAEGGYIISIPRMDLTGDWPDGGTSDIVNVTFDYRAHTIPPTITRVPAAAGE